MDSSIEFIDLSSEKTYFTQVPNIVDELPLSPLAFRLYIKLKRTAGDKGCCWKSTRTLAKELDVSIGTISNLKKELEKSFDLLDGKSLIKIQKGNPQKNETDKVYIVNIWPENMLYFAKKAKASLDSTPPPLFTGVNTPVHRGEHKKNSIKKNINPPPTPPPPKILETSKKLKKEEDRIYSCLENLDLTLAEKKRISSYPEELVKQAIKYAYHSTTKNTHQHIRRIMHFLKNPEAYRDHMKVIDAPVPSKKSFITNIKEFFRKGQFYQGYECLIDDFGISFLKTGHLQPYSVHWKDILFKNKLLELLNRLKINIPIFCEN